MVSDQASSEKMVVIHIVPNGNLTSGGAAYASIRLAHEQARLGIVVYVLEVNPNIRTKALWWCNDVKYLDFYSTHGLVKKLIYLRYLFSKTNTIVHFHGVWFPKYFPYFLLALSTHTPFIISPHGSLEPGALKQKYLKKYLARKLFFNFFLLSSSAFWACSEKERISIQTEFPKVRVDIVSIGVDMPSLEAQSEEKNVTTQRKIILVISRINPGKGLLNLVRAWNIIRDDNWQLILAGPDENGYQSKIEEEIRKLNLTRFFSFLGYVDSKQRDDLYRKADIFVLPSLSENFGIVVAEAMSYGVPVLTTNETPWTYVGLNRGCLCVGTKSDELSQGLKKMMEINEADRTKMGLASRLFIYQNFSWAKVAQISQSKLILALSQ